jgi:hypothetical protein
MIDCTLEELRNALDRSASLKIFWIDKNDHHAVWDADTIHIYPESTPQEFAELVRRQALRKFRGHQDILDDLQRCGQQMEVKCWASGQFRRSVYLNPESPGDFRITRLCEGFNDPTVDEYGFKSLEVMVELKRVRRDRLKHRRGQQSRLSLVEMRKSVEQTIKKLQASSSPEFLAEIYMANIPLLTYRRYEPLIPRSEYQPSKPLKIVILSINKTYEPRIKIPAQVILELTSSINAYSRILEAVFKAWNIYSYKHHNKEFWVHVRDFMQEPLFDMLRMGLWVLPQISDAKLKQDGGGRRRTVYYYEKHVDIEEFFDGREERSLTMEAHLAPDDP